MTCNASFRPTAYRDLHLGGAWNAYLNWAFAKRTGGEFVVIQDDMWMLLGGTMCFTPEVGIERTCEDLEWLGLKPDRIEWGMERPEPARESNRAKRKREKYNRWRKRRHRWAAKKLGAGLPIAFGDIGAISCPYRYSQRPDGFGDKAGPACPPSAGMEGYGFTDTLSFNAYHMACCVVDDIDFRVGAWVAGNDQKVYWAWCEDAYYRLGYNPPLMMFTPTLKRPEDPDKISKSAPPPASVIECSIRNLREKGGYTAEEILETLRACSLESYRQGHESIIIPHGILTVETKGTLRHVNPNHLKMLNSPGPEIPPELLPFVLQATQRRIEEGTGAVRMP